MKEDFDTEDSKWTKHTISSITTPDTKNTIELIEEFLKRNHEFRHNTVSGQLEFRKKGESHFAPLIDRDENNFWRAIQKDKKLEYADATCSLSTLRSILYSGFSKEYDPLKEYFTSLTQWDKTTDYITLLANTVKTDNDQLFHRFLKKWLVAVVASIMEPATVNQTVLVFSGKQGIGKTSWILKLAPEHLRNYVYSGSINLNNKDTLIYLASCLLINLDELENMNSTEIGALKETITKPQVKLRRVYARNAEDMPRRASFAGSVNSSHFLNDSTGSRRFLCFEALKIDYQHQVDLNKVYAQAYALYQEGFKHWLDDAEIKELEANNSKFQRTTVEEELVLEEFTPAGEGDSECLFYTTTQIANHLTKKVNTFAVTNASKQRLGKALKKHGFKTYKKGGIQKYALSLKQPGTSTNPETISG
ncbi:VapE domain-containing protein [Rufibacter tibetensis]|uniref:VapE domain-containing protein n=1 Tax=Rufibacter tibetensis TaxID=512763 RepID=UPI000783F44B|nr:VapE domain-containing protein [Rufibacter tibetensis]